MKSPEQDPLDLLLDQSLQSASRRLDGENFSRQLAACIAKDKRRVKLTRLIPMGMGVLAAIILTLVTPPKVDFSGGLSSLASLWETTRPALAALMQPIPGSHNIAILWVVLAALTLISSLWFTHRDSAEFRL